MKILYYSHHHGSGHARNATYFYQILKEKLHVVTSSNFEFPQGLSNTVLADEKETEKDFLGGRDMLPSYLHFSPVGNHHILQRSHTILNICLQKQIDLAIVDLSVEVATLLRVASVPFAYVRLPGNRNDVAHLECYKAASFLLAYFPEELEDNNTPDWVADKTIYLGFLYNAKTSSKNIEKTSKNAFRRDDIILVVKGYGGHEEVDEVVKSLKDKLDGYYVSVGPIEEETKPYYNHVISYSNDVEGLMRISSRIVIPPSLNLTAEALNSHKPITVIPCKRHFEEHEVMAKNLIACGYADSPENTKTTFKTFEPKENSILFLQRLKEYKNLEQLVKAYKIKIV